MPSQLLLVTGATGFIGSETVYQALAKGYRARLTVRKPEQIDVLKERFRSHASQLEFVVVPKLDNKEALVKAMQGVGVVIHVASPMPATDDDLRTVYVGPAVQATLAVLEAAEAVPSVKRVVITSSVLSLAPIDWTSRPGFVVETGVNADLAVDLDAPSPPPPAGPFYKYHISKILAHRATIDWAAAHKPAFDIITVHPYYVLGFDRTQKPGVPVTEPAFVNGLYLAALQSEQPSVPSAYVDVKDVAAIHVNAIDVAADKLAARGGVTEYIAYGPYITWAKLRAFVASKYPSFPLKQTSDGAFGKPQTSSTEPASRDLGVSFRDPLESFGAFLDQHIQA